MQQAELEARAHPLSGTPSWRRQGPIKLACSSIQPDADSN